MYSFIRRLVVEAGAWGALTHLVLAQIPAYGGVSILSRIASRDGFNAYGCKRKSRFPYKWFFEPDPPESKTAITRGV